MINRKEFLGLLSNRPLISDGAMGTMLNQRGVAFDECFDSLNITKPALVAEVHREYIEAGAQIIQTNTFGSNRFKLTRHGLENQVAEVNTAGVDLARRVVMASFKKVLIAGDVGPLGVRLAPYGRLQTNDAHALFSEQIQALIQAGVDLIILETMTDLFEIREAIKVARELAPDIPIIASMSYTRDDRTTLGDSPSKVVKELSEAGADVIGANCGGGPNQLLRILKQMRSTRTDGKFSIMPNAGWPEQVGGRIMYPAAPEYFGEYALSFWQGGANIIGGCCGTTPQHTSAMASSVQGASIEHKDENLVASIIEIEEVLEIEKPTLLAQKLNAGKFLISVEMDPPRGLAIHKLLAGASLLSESGADVINVADSPMARMRMSPWAVCDLVQRNVGIETVLHFPTRGRNLLRVQGDLLAAHAIGVRNVFVVMGDPTSIGDYPDAMDNYDLVPTGLIKLIKQGFNVGLDHAGSDIGQPTTFFVGCACNLNPPEIEKELRTLKKKIDAGADFLLTQPIYQPEILEKFLFEFNQHFGELKIPLLLGILPLASSRHASFLQHEVPGISIPNHILEKMGDAGDHGDITGMEMSIQLIEKLKPDIQGVYIMPAFNRFDIVSRIIEAIKQ